MTNEPPKLRLAGLDGLRGVSILLVIMCHSLWYKHAHLSERAAEIANRVTMALGLFGVPIFFVISGFLITYLLLREEEKAGAISLKYFWIRRFLRIGPPVLLYFLFVVVYAGIQGIQLRGLDLTAVLLFFRDLVNGNSITDHFWSLSIEEQFYVVWPLGLVFLPRHGRLRTALVLLVTLPLIRIFSACVFPHDLYEIVTRVDRFDSILAGCALAIAWESRGYGGIAAGKGDLICAGGLAMVAIAWIVSMVADVHPNFFGTPTVTGELLQELVTALLNLGVVCIMITLVAGKTRFGAVINMKWLTGIGVISYSLYLWQQFFFFAPGLPHWMYYLPVRIASIFAAGLFSYYVVERPMNRLRQRIGRPPAANKRPTSIKRIYNEA